MLASQLRFKQKQLFTCLLWALSAWQVQAQTCVQPNGTQGACPAPAPQGEKFLARPACIGSQIRVFDGQHIFYGQAELALVNPAPFASDPIVCVAYGSKAPAPTIHRPPAAPSPRDVAPAGKTLGSTNFSQSPCSGVCPPDNQRRLWVVTRSGLIFREEDKDPSLQLGLVAVAGRALAIKAGADHSIWAIAADTVAGGHSIYKWSGTDWSKLPVNGVNVGVAHNGRPWVITDAGKLLRQDVVGLWLEIPLPAAAWDVYFDPAAGHAPTAFIQRTQAPTATTQGKFVMWRWAGTGWQPGLPINADAMQVSTWDRTVLYLAGLVRQQLLQ